jgi:hypothetical protein
MLVVPVMVHATEIWMGPWKGYGTGILMSLSMERGIGNAMVCVTEIWMGL